MIADHLTGIAQLRGGPLEGRGWPAGQFEPRVERVLHAHSGPDLPAACDEPLLRGAGGHRSRQGFGGRMPDRPLLSRMTSQRRRALMLPEAARYDELLEMPKDGGSRRGNVTSPPWKPWKSISHRLPGSCRRTTTQFEDDILEEMMRAFDSEALRTASGDVFGRINEYFLVRVLEAARTRQRRVLHAALHRPDHRQRDRARSRRDPRSRLRLWRHVRAVEPLH